MTVSADVLRALCAHPTVMTDRELAATLGKSHQHINQACRKLVTVEGAVEIWEREN
jgi:hypothetical protein